MGNSGLNSQELDRLFIRARATAPEPSEALSAKVMQDALALMPAAKTAPPTPVAARAAAPVHGHLQALSTGWERRFWASLSAGFGGGGAVASLGAVAVIALFLGYSAPAGFAEDLIPAATDAGIEIEPVAIYFLAGG